MDVTVLGNSSRYLLPLGAGTSYLVHHEGTRVLLDAGNGTHLRLASALGEHALDAILVSHFHVDAVADLLPVLFSLRRATPVYLPDRARARLSDLLRAYSMDRSWIDKAVLKGVGGASRATIGGIDFTFAKSFHGCPGVSVRLAAGDRVLCYLSDTGPRPWLADLARDADLLVAHTLLLDKDAHGQVGDRNLSAGGAGRLAREAGAKRLALAHVPFYLNARASVDEARDAYAGDVIVLQEGVTYTV